MVRFAIAVALAAVSSGVMAGEAAAEKPKAEKPEAEKPKPEKLAPGTYAHIETAKGEIVVRLLAESAPKAVANFVELAKGERPWKDAKGRWVARPYYNGLTFHRIENGSLKLIQGGCPKGDGSGGPGYKFDDEIDEKLKFGQPGVVAMANSGRDTNGSQFFITVAPAPSLSGRYTIFGEVARGIDVTRAISEMPAVEIANSGIHKAKDPVVIKKVTIEEVKAEAKTK